jgi:DNA repair protein RadC
MKPIKHWQASDRPREKMKRLGCMHLSDTELMAILIQTGSSKASAMDLSRDLLEHHQNDLHLLARCSAKELMKVNGIGPAKAALILSALELGRRRMAREYLKSDTINDSKSVAHYLRAKLMDLSHEVFAVIFLNRANRITHFEIISSGGITGTVADPRIILKKALEEEAVSLILCHNHPSGNLRPSKADEEITHKIRHAAGYFDIRVLDHIIVSTDGYYSFADEGNW